eukprot:TRINITY_DN12926_c0_g1_i1.p1 TRINITY_DN12926_c0_g1~~TRINITY_DN12926_c0_g1_i1.p1  ORF type:complete len:811 (+),score=210.24 TRINITY_DN12926_c0_g1_i1:78-2435(+)
MALVSFDSQRGMRQFEPRNSLSEQRKSRAQSVRFGSMEAREAERLRRHVACSAHFSAWDGCSEFVERYELHQAVVSFCLVQSRKRRFVNRWNAMCTSGRVPLELGPAECAAAMSELCEELMSDEFDAFVAHLTRACAVIEEVSSPGELRKRRILVNLFQRWDKGGEGLLPLASVAAVLRRLQLVPQSPDDPVHPADFPVLERYKPQLPANCDPRDPYESVPDGQIDIVRFVGLMHSVLDPVASGEFEWYAAARRVFARVEEEVSNYGMLAAAYAGISASEEAQREVGDCDTAARHAFDGLAPHHVSEFCSAYSGASPPLWVERVCTPPCLLLGLSPGEEGEDEKYCAALQGAFHEDAEGVLQLMRCFPQDAVSYKLIRTVMDEVHEEYFDAVRLFSEHRMLSAMVEWTSHLLRAVCLRNHWDFSDVPVYTPPSGLTPAAIEARSFPLLRATRPASGQREGQGRRSAAERLPQVCLPPPLRLRSRLGPTVAVLPSAQPWLGTQQTARISLAGRQGARRPRKGDAAALICEKRAALPPQPPRGTITQPHRSLPHGVLALSPRAPGSDADKYIALQDRHAAQPAGNFQSSDFANGGVTSPAQLPAPPPADSPQEAAGSAEAIDWVPPPQPAPPTTSPPQRRPSGSAQGEAGARRHSDDCGKQVEAEYQEYVRRQGSPDKRGLEAALAERRRKENEIRRAIDRVEQVSEPEGRRAAVGAEAAERGSLRCALTSGEREVLRSGAEARDDARRQRTEKRCAETDATPEIADANARLAQIEERLERLAQNTR